MLDISSFIGGRFLTHLDLPAPSQVWTVAKADQQIVKDEPKICITFAEFPGKSLACNKVNLERAGELYSKDAESWVGNSLLVYRSKTMFGGQMVLCIRVAAPGSLPPDPVFDRNGNPAPAGPTTQIAGTPPHAPPTTPSEPPAPPWGAE